MTAAQIICARTSGRRAVGIAPERRICRRACCRHGDRLPGGDL